MRRFLSNHSTRPGVKMKLRLLALLAPLTLAGCGYNRIQTLDETASSAKQNIEVQLQRRADLVPNLVNTVKGYAAHEEAVFTQVANCLLYTSDAADERSSVDLG